MADFRVYFDTGALVKLYYLEPGSTQVAARAASRGRLWRTVDEKTAVLPLDEQVLGDPDALLDLLAAVLRRRNSRAQSAAGR